MTKNGQRRPRTDPTSRREEETESNDPHLKGGIAHSNTEKDPANWTTGDETMTGAQASYLQTLCEEAGATFDNTLTKAEASLRIDELQKITGRGRQAANER